jgi:YVTN family beta-propeller protein
VVAAPSLHRVYVTATGTNELAVIDDQSFRVVARVPAGDYPNGLAYAPREAKIYVSNNRGGREWVIDARTNKVLAPIDLGGPGGGNTLYDPRAGHIFVTVHGVNGLVEIDPATDKIVSRHRLSGVQNCHSLALDSANRLAFVTCGGITPKLVVFNLEARQQKGTYSVGAHPDVLAFDEGLGRLYVSSESGTVSVFDEKEGVVRKTAEAFLAPDAHSVAVDQKSHLVYFPLQNIGGRPVLRIMKPEKENESVGQEKTTSTLRLIKRIPLPQVEGRIDHMAVEVAGQRLFVAALGNRSLEVVDLKKGERVRSISPLGEPQGIRYLSASNIVVVANRSDGLVTFFDAGTWKPLRVARSSGDADNVRLDPDRKQVIVGYGDGALGFLSETGERLFDVPLAGHPESFQIETAAGKVYVNVPEAHQVAVVDAEQRKVSETWPLSDGDNYPMALDEANHRLFVVTRKPPKVLVFDTVTGRQVATIEADADSDDIFYDPARRRLYASFGQGTVVVYEQTDADHYKILTRVQTAPGARTSFFSPELNQFFVAVPHRQNPSAEILVYQVGQ